MDLGRLRDEYPLGPDWKDPLVFCETARIADVDIHLVGLQVENQLGEVVSGSAGDLNESPLRRAYFELVERASIVTMGRSGAGEAAEGASSEDQGRLPAPDASPDPNRWQYARSNGVAVGPSWNEACRRAEWELIERDRVLRSWYGELPVVPILSSMAGMPADLAIFYSFDACVFGPSTHSGVEVAGVFAFPKTADAPMVYGFGARSSVEEALDVAASECIQRLGFLWGEPIPTERPRSAPTPSFHQEFFLWPPAQRLLRGWLDGEHARRSANLRTPEPVGPVERRFVDLTPPELSGKLFVAKAISGGEMPLLFGEGHPDLGSLPKHLKIHPVA